MAVLQRFGGALNLNVHVHALVLDGVFAKDESGALVFHPAPGLAALDVAEELAAGEKVVDVGSGGGIDSLIAAHMVGASGQVVGVDMTPSMLEKARAAAADSGIDNVEFREAYSVDFRPPLIFPIVRATGH